MAAYHYCKAFIVDAVVVDWRLQQVRVLFQPGESLVVGHQPMYVRHSWHTHHLGRFKGVDSILASKLWFLLKGKYGFLKMISWEYLTPDFSSDDMI